MEAVMGCPCSAQDDEEELSAAPSGADPYTDASSLLIGTFPRFSEEEEEEQRAPRRLEMKRKVLRRRPDGGVEITDESASAAELWGAPRETLELGGGDDSISEGEIDSSSSEENPDEIPDGFLFPLQDFASQSSPTSRPKSFIPPRFKRRRSKTDPVAKYWEYKREWDKFPAPGEDPRLELRRSVREGMRFGTEPPGKPPPSRRSDLAYTIPTQKKRAALRWGVRWDLAHGQAPRNHLLS